MAKKTSILAGRPEIPPSRFKSPVEVNTGDSRVSIDEDVLGDSRLKDLVSLGMPNEDRVSIKWAGEYFDEAYCGYTIELLGVEAEDLEPTKREILLWVGAATPHHVRYQKKKTHGSFVVESGAAMYVWVCRVRAPDSEIIYEEAWNPPLMMFVPMVNNVWIRHAEIASGLIQAIEVETDDSNTAGTSQPPKTGGKKKLPEDHWLRLALVAAFNVGKNGDPLGNQRLADAMQCSKRTVERYKGLYPETWQKIEDEHKEGLKTYSSKRDPAT